MTVVQRRWCWETGTSVSAVGLGLCWKTPQSSSCHILLPWCHIWSHSLWTALRQVCSSVFITVFNYSTHSNTFINIRCLTTVLTHAERVADGNVFITLPKVFVSNQSLHFLQSVKWRKLKIKEISGNSYLKTSIKTSLKQNPSYSKHCDEFKTFICFVFLFLHSWHWNYY